MVKDLKEIWERGVTLEGVIRGVQPWDGKPVIAADDPDHPSDAFYVGQDEWDYLPDLRARLHSGKWVAIGYRMPRRPDSQLEEVPGEIANHAEFYMDHSAITGDGLRYAGVRLVSSSLLGPERQIIRRGRPSHEGEIIAAYRDLVRDGEVDFCAPLAPLFPKIKLRVAARLGIALSELKGVGDETIRQRIRPLFDKDRSQKL